MLYAVSEKVAKASLRSRIFKRALPTPVSQVRRFVALAPQTSYSNVAAEPFMFSTKQSTVHNTNSQDFYLPLNFQINEEKLREVVPSNERYAFDIEKDMIGEGFFAKVYKARDLVSNELVAIKIVKKDNCPREIFEQELRVMSQLRDLKLKAEVSQSKESYDALGLHRDVFECSNELCFVFDLKSGGDLFDEVVDNGALSEEEAKTLLKQLAPSLESLHANNFVHRDIKLENILVCKEEERTDKLETAKLTDFGYAKKLGDKDKFKNPAGTFGYVAPEVLSARRYGPQCDIWSLGSVMFTVLAGYQPFPYKENPKASGSYETNPKAVIARELEAINYGTREANWNKEMEKPAFKNLSDDLKNLLKSMLDPNPQSRITASEILQHPWMTQTASGEEPELLSCLS